MKSVAFLVCMIFLLSAPATAQEQKELFPDTLLNWLRIIETDGFSVIYANDEDGEYTAISVDNDGDLLIATHDHNTKDNDGDSAVNKKERRFRIVDVQTGDNLWDKSSKKETPDSAKITYKGNNGIAKWSMTNSYPRGILYPLKPYEGRKVRYEASNKVGEAEETKVSVILTIPERTTKRKIHQQ